jgi:Collagen triple helix repeat (20 copies)
MKAHRTILFASLAALSAFAVSAQAAITVDRATIKQGVITLQGTAEPGVVITLDGGVAKVTADKTGKFDFGELNYVPGSCIIKLTSPGQTSVLASVRHCDPITLKSKGEWKPATSYITDELVFYSGSTWRAKGKVPAQIHPSEMNGKYWELFAEGGAEGPRGATGAQGPAGPAGPQGVVGPPGPQGVAGTTGQQGIQGTQGVAGATGAPGAPGFFAGQVDMLDVIAIGTTVYTGNGVALTSSPLPVGIPSPVATTITGIRCYGSGIRNSNAASILISLFRNGQIVTHNGVPVGCGSAGTSVPSGYSTGPFSRPVAVGDLISVEIVNLDNATSGYFSWSLITQ